MKQGPLPPTFECRDIITHFIFLLAIPYINLAQNTLDVSVSSVVF